MVVSTHAPLLSHAPGLSGTWRWTPALKHLAPITYHRYLAQCAGYVMTLSGMHGLNHVKHASSPMSSEHAITYEPTLAPGTRQRR